MRVTTNSMMRRYNDRLSTVMGNMNMASDRVITGRKYMKASEDPSSSVKGIKLRREFLKNEDYMTNIREVRSRFDSVESSMMKISDVAEDAYVDVLTAINGTTSADQRQTIAAKLREMQKTIVMDMNAQDGGDYIFGGTSTKNLPFNLDDNGVLTYRGIDVNTTDPDEMLKLQAYANETINIDLGFGMTTDPITGAIAPASAYNMATPGITVLGFGATADGTPKNIVTLLGKMADELDKPVLDEAVLQKYNKQFDVQRNSLISQVTKLGSNTMFLDYTQKRLEDNEFNFNNKILAAEYMDPAKAISDFKMQDYTYRAALKMGVDILTPSFIDFMR